MTSTVIFALTYHTSKHLGVYKNLQKDLFMKVACYFPYYWMVKPMTFMAMKMSQKVITTSSISEQN